MSDLDAIKARLEDLQTDGAKAAMWRTADIARLSTALEAVLGLAEARSTMLRTTAERLNRRVLDRDPDRDIDAAIRYSHYAIEAESNSIRVRATIESVLTP